MEDTKFRGGAPERVTGKMKFFQGLPYKGPVFTKTVITLSFRVHFGPTSTKNARDEHGNLEYTNRLRQESQSTIKFGT